MDKRFFESLQARAKDFAARGDLSADAVTVEIRLHSGRTYVVDRIVETADSFIQFDGWDSSDEDEHFSLAVPYHQINHVVLSKSKIRQRGAGFAKHAG